MALPFYSNWPTFGQPHHATAAVPLSQPPPELLPFHDNFTLSDHTSINPMLDLNHHFSSFNNGVITNNILSFNNGIKLPTLSSSYNPLQQHLLKTTPLPDLTTQVSSFTHEWEWPALVPNVCDHGGQFFSLHPELPPLPEIYRDCGVDSFMAPSYEGGQGGEVMEVEERSNYVEVKKQINGGGGRSLSAQSMAARVRRRKISQKTQELGKLVPGGHRMSTAEMFQAAVKYIKFLQAQVGVLQLMASSPGPSGELQALVTSPSVQEKLYAAERCIVPQELEETLVHDHQE